MSCQGTESLRNEDEMYMHSCQYFVYCKPASRSTLRRLDSEMEKGGVVKFATHSTTIRRLLNFFSISSTAVSLTHIHHVKIQSCQAAKRCHQRVSKQESQNHRPANATARRWAPALHFRACFTRRTRDHSRNPADIGTESNDAEIKSLSRCPCCSI